MAKKVLELLFETGPSVPNAEALGSSYLGGLAGRQGSRAIASLLNPHGEANALGSVLDTFSRGLADWVQSSTGAPEQFVNAAVSFTTRFGVDYTTGKATAAIVNQIDRTKLYKHLGPNAQHFVNSAVTGTVAGTIGSQLSPLNQPYATNLRGQFTGAPQAYDTSNWSPRAQALYNQLHQDDDFNGEPPPGASRRDVLRQRLSINAQNAIQYSVQNYGSIFGQLAGTGTATILLTPRSIRKPFYRKLAVQTTANSVINVVNAARPPGREGFSLGPTRANLNPDIQELIETGNKPLAQTAAVPRIPRVRRR